VSRSQTQDAARLDAASPGFIRLSRILIVLITLLLAIIPVSERYSALDSFPHGQDTELNLLAFFMILGLILLFVRSSKKRLRSLLAFGYLLLSMIRLALSLIPDSRHGLVLTDAHHPPIPGSSLDVYNLPLRI
jgi:peptidoglycan/LPS O-acetylase OafA/YrhL